MGESLFCLFLCTNMTMHYIAVMCSTNAEMFALLKLADHFRLGE